MVEHGAEELEVRLGEQRGVDAATGEDLGATPVDRRHAPADLLGHIFDFPFDGSIAADIPTGARETFVVRRPEIERVDSDGLRFAEGSSLLVPLAEDHTPAHALVTALARLQAAPPCRLLVVGHASSTSPRSTAARPTSSACCDTSLE